jgi:hypothetical protein
LIAAVKAAHGGHGRFLGDAVLTLGREQMMLKGKQVHAREDRETVGLRGLAGRSGRASASWV